MKSITFDEQNHSFAKDQREYETLYGYLAKDGTFVSCWELSFWDKVRILFGAKLWIHILTFNKSLQPIFPTFQKSYLEETIHDNNQVKGS